MCLILNKDFIFSENTCIYVLKPSDNKNRAMSVMRRKVSEVSSKQQNTVLIKGTINSVWNEMGLLGQHSLLCPKIHLPVYMLWLTQTIKKIQKMLLTEETGHGAYGNSVQSSRFFYKSKNSSKI